MLYLADIFLLITLIILRTSVNSCFRDFDFLFLRKKTECRYQILNTTEPVVPYRSKPENDNLRGLLLTNNRKSPQESRV